MVSEGIQDIEASDWSLNEQHSFQGTIFLSVYPRSACVADPRNHCRAKAGVGSRRGKQHPQIRSNNPPEMVGEAPQDG